MLTDDGFLFFINATPNNEVLNYVRYGFKKSDIVDLNPPSSITALQSSEFTQYPSDPYLHLSMVYYTVLYTQNYNSSKVTWTLRTGNSGVSQVGKSYYERGLYSSTGKLLAYNLNTNTKKTFLYPLEQLNSSVVSYNLDFVIPFKEKVILQDIKNRGVVQSYKIKLKSRGHAPSSGYSPLDGFRYSLKLTEGDSESGVGSPQVLLESYDISTKTVTYNLVVTPPGNYINNPGISLKLESSFGVFDITFHDAATDVNLGLPLVDIGSLVIPITLNLGEVM